MGAGACMVDAGCNLCEDRFQGGTLCEGVEHFEMSVHLIVCTLAFCDIANVEDETTCAGFSAQIGYGCFDPAVGPVSGDDAFT